MTRPVSGPRTRAYSGLSGSPSQAVSSSIALAWARTDIQRLRASALVPSSAVMARRARRPDASSRRRRSQGRDTEARRGGRWPGAAPLSPRSCARRTAGSSGGTRGSGSAPASRPTPWLLLLGREFFRGVVELPDDLVLAVVGRHEAGEPRADLLEGLRVLGL